MLPAAFRKPEVLRADRALAPARRGPVVVRRLAGAGPLRKPGRAVDEATAVLCAAARGKRGDVAVPASFCAKNGRAAASLTPRPPRPVPGNPSGFGSRPAGGARPGSALLPEPGAPCTQRRMTSGEPGPVPSCADCDIFLDITPDVCPLTFVKTRLMIDGMESGQKAEVRLNDGEPLKNVPGAVREHGHTVLSLEPERAGGGRVWRLGLQKS